MLKVVAHMIKFPRIPFDLKWVYDTNLSIQTCLECLLSPNILVIHTSSRVSCVQISDTQVQIVFRNTERGRFRRTRYNAEFYRIESGLTVIVLRFVDELFGGPPFTTLDEIDEFLKTIIQAFRRI